MKSTIVYIIDPDTYEVLMAKKLKKIGIGCWFGYGGKINSGETAIECIVRETFEESGNIIRLPEQDLEPVALVRFYNKAEQDPLVDEPMFETMCYRIFMRKGDVGQPLTTDEMGDPTWFSILHLPLEEMKSGDELIVPAIILGTPIKGWIHFSSTTGEVIGSSILPCKREELII